MATTAEPAWQAGDLLGGRYRLAELVGSGGTSVVWRAHDEVLDRPVAVKMLAQAGSVRVRLELRGGGGKRTVPSATARRGARVRPAEHAPHRSGLRLRRDRRRRAVPGHGVRH